jgi:hypothetical protein
MKPIALFLLFMMLFSLGSNAQKPWRAKLFVHFLDSNNQIVTDTVWFGTDSLGDVGYQPWLDVIDTNLQRNKVYSSDELIKTQYNTDCANLKVNIIKFKKRENTFKFYAFGNPVALSWDTTDLKYYDSSFTITYLDIIAYNGYIFDIDRYIFRIIKDSYTMVNGDYEYVGSTVSEIDSIRIIREMRQGSICRTKNEFFEFDINFIMGLRFDVGIAEINPLPELIVYPVPFNNFLNIENKIGNKLLKIKIYDLTGRLVFEAPLNNSDIRVDTIYLPSGVYYLKLYDEVTALNKPLKIIKL